MKTDALYASILAAALLSGTATYSLAQTTSEQIATTNQDEDFDMGWFGLLGLLGLAGLMRRDRSHIATTNRV